MTRPFPSPGLNMRRQSRPPVDCRVCDKPIEKPGPMQKVHAGECHREWNRRNSEKFHAKQRKAKARKKERRRVGAISGRKPERDPKYLEFIRSLPCCVPTCTSKNLHKWADAAGSVTEAAHVGDRGLRQKCSDYETIPLCAFHHRISPLSHHRAGKRFWDSHKLDKEMLWAELRAKYAELRAAA